MDQETNSGTLNGCYHVQKPSHVDPSMYQYECKVDSVESHL